MEPNLVYFQLKIKQFLEKLTDWTCLTEVDIYLKDFLNKLADRPSIVKLPIFTEWVVYTVYVWQCHNVTPPEQNICFTLDLATLLAANEQKFYFLKSNTCFLEFVENLKTTMLFKTSPNVRLSYMKLLSSFLDYESGTDHVVLRNCWIEIFQMCLDDQDSTVVSESKQFIFKFLHNNIDRYSDCCNRMVLQILSPLQVSSSSFKELVEEKHLAAAFKTIGNLLEYFLEMFYANDDFRVLAFVLKIFNVEESIAELIQMSQNKHLMFYLSKIMFIMHFCELYSAINSKQCDFIDAQNSIQEIQRNFVLNITKRSFEDVQKICVFSHLYWRVLASKMSILRVFDGKELNAFGDQFVVVQLMPHTSFILKYCVEYEPKCNEWYDDFAGIYINKLIRMCSPEILRVLFDHREHVKTLSNLSEICVASLRDIETSRKHFCKDQAALVFQTMLYCVRSIVDLLQKHPERHYVFASKRDYIFKLLDLLYIFIDEFYITWKDSMESINLMAICLNFLSLPFWSSSLIMKALKIVKICIERYLIPHLLLLVDRALDSSMMTLGQTLSTLLENSNNDVKILALGIVKSMSVVCIKEFESLEEVIMKSKLPTLIVKMLINDQDDLVRARCLSCLKDMIQMTQVWTSILKNKQLIQLITEMPLHETNSEIKLEALEFICTARDKQMISANSLNKIYFMMTHLSINDSHEAVRLSTLNFWKSTIHNHLQDAGMIDGIFPEVTFSKQQKKIVTLTEAKISKCLWDTLNKLSSIGCLEVLSTVIKEENDHQVLAEALRLTQNLKELFDKYNVNCARKSVIKTDSDILDYDAVIGQNICSKNNNCKRLNVVTPDEFLLFLEQDLSAALKNKHDISNDHEEVEGILDEMLDVYNFNCDKKRLYIVQKKQQNC